MGKRGKVENPSEEHLDQSAKKEDEKMKTKGGKRTVVTDQTDPSATKKNLFLKKKKTPLDMGMSQGTDRGKKTPPLWGLEGVGVSRKSKSEQAGEVFTSGQIAREKRGQKKKRGNWGHGKGRWN